MQTLILYAPNVGGGGGLVLLRELLGANWFDTRVIAILDRRAELQIGGLLDRVQVHWVQSSVRGRWSAERLLRRTASAGDVVLCFHNLPPLFSTQARVFCYVHNAGLVGLMSTKEQRYWVRLRYRIEHGLARLLKVRVDRYLVQTQTMKEALWRWYGAGAPPIEVVPFAPPEYAAPPQRSISNQPTKTKRSQLGVPEPVWDFIYVGSGLAHKNHRRLFAAWRMLAAQGVLPSLAVTLHPEDRDLHVQMRDMVAEGIKVYDLGELSRAQVAAAYQQSGALIFPSYAESFGLPLIEAQAVGLPIVAPELDYVRDVCEPVTTFDPLSPRSISRAVLRFLDIPVERVAPLSPDRFVATVAALAANDASERPAPSEKRRVS